MEISMSEQIDIKQQIKDALSTEDINVIDSITHEERQVDPEFAPWNL
mgnify:CR=1 FL=1